VAGIYLEDLYIDRHSGAAAWPASCYPRWPPNVPSNGYTRLSWAVLNWNVNAIALTTPSAGPQTEWTTYRVSGANWRWLRTETATAPARYFLAAA
jgi:hypothetical protein